MDKAKAAVGILILVPGVTVCEAMILAKFTEEEASTKSMQRKVSRNLVKKIAMKGKAGATVATAKSVPPIKDIDLDGNESPNKVSSMTAEEEWKPKKHRLNAKQKQEKREADLRAKAKYSQAHKAATKLYAAELEKGEKGMSSRKVEAAIKKKDNGVGPSHATIIHYVVTKGEVNTSPQKRGPIGHIPALTYKSLCAGFATFMRINQLNCTGGVNHQGKMAPIVAETMMVDVETTQENLKRLACDTAIDLGCGKLNFAEERRVRWTTYNNLDMWFNMWERELLKYGLMELDARGLPHIPHQKLRQTLNFNETSLSLDGSSINWEGRPASGHKKKDNGVGLSHATIIYYVVTKGKVNMSPQKRGPIGHILALTYKSLCARFATFMQINQLNCTSGVNHRGKMAPIVAETMMVDVETAREILKRLAHDTAIDLGCGKLNFAEERRVRWTTYNNLDMWFNMWERELLKHGLMELDARGLPHIPCHKLHQILNFDETSLSLDGSSINRGGRPAAYWFDPRLPQVGIMTAKSAYSSTMIMGSNAYGEELPPHFQFTSSAQTKEGKIIKIECICYMKKVRGEFGMGVSASFGLTFGMNEKGGMDMEEFAKYLHNAIMTIYPNAAPVFFLM